jgi:S1-C subfamily serine protease
MHLSLFGIVPTPLEDLNMRVDRMLAVLLVFTLGATPSWGQSTKDSVVRVFASLRLPNPVRPWAKQSPVDVMGTGIVIEGKRILTNAHIVLYAGEVFVQAREGGDRINARVVSIGPEIDLATLKLEDETFFEKRPPIPRASNRPVVNTAVSVLGYATGGIGLSVTHGSVSRIDYALYNDLIGGLQIQVTAPVEHGNSGGPALVNGKMIGLTFRRLQSIGYIIPNEEIDAYLADVADGRYDGKPRVIDHFQTLLNEALRKNLGLARSDHGIMVRRPGKEAPTYPLREGDVLTRFGETAIDNEGMVDYEQNLRLPFPSLVPRLEKDGTVPASLIRGGKPLTVRLPVSREDDRLIKPYRGQYPPYFVLGPLVFSPAIEQAVPTYMQGNPVAVVGSPLATRDSDRVTFPGEELVVVTAPLLAHPITRGYSDPFGQVVKDVDGVRVKNLRHLVELLRDGAGEYLTIRFWGELSETMVFNRKVIEEATAELMAENGIPRRGSEELTAVWSAKPVAAR